MKITAQLFFVVVVFAITIQTNAQTGPGGVGTTDGTSNLVLWLDANEIIGTNDTTITNWTDQSGNGYDFSDGNGAVFNVNQSNGYPAFNFNGTSDYFEKSFESKLNTNKFTVFTSNNVTSSGSYKAVLSNRDDPPGDDRLGYILYARPTTNNWSFWTGITSVWETTESNTSTAGTWSHQMIRYNGSTDFKELFIDGIAKASSTQGMLVNTVRPFRIGAGRNESTPDYFYKGSISETIIYDVDINEAQGIIVSNYLSAKYNMPLAANDFYIQDDAVNGDFDHNVAGIGQGLDGTNQTDSQGTGIIRINTPSALSNGDYLFWGENEKEATYDFTVIDSDTKRINTTWRVSKQNNLGTVFLSFNENDINLDTTSLQCASLKLITSTEANFVTKNSYELSFNAGIYSVDNLPLNDGDYFTIEYSVNKTTWNGATWSNNTPTLSTITFIEDDLTTSGTSIETCTCTVSSGKMLTISSGDYLLVDSDITNEGTIIIEHEGSLVQRNDVAVLSGDGLYKINKTTNDYTEYDYTYWSSPVPDDTIEAVFNTHSALSQGSSTNSTDNSPANYIFSLNTANFFDGADTDEYDDNGDDWEVASGAMTPGRGYAAMGAGADFPFNTNFASGLQQSVFFQDTRVNNGVVTIPVYQDVATTDAFTNQNLIGNPYPSAIDVHKLYTENSSILEGTFYFWTHDSTISNGNPGPWAYNFTNDDYATGVSDGNVYSSTTAGSAGTTAPQFIASGQGFFVNVKDGVSNPSTLTFNNAMRVTSENTHFRESQENIDRLWLNMTDATGLYRQIYIGFHDHATDSFAYGQDGERLMNGVNPDFYSLIPTDSRRFAIQNLASFNEEKTIDLGVEIIETGIYEIAIDHLEGVFETNQAIYLEDTYTHAYHNLKEGAYTFGSVTGEAINDRFVLHFVETGLGVDEKNEINSLLVYPNPSTDVFNLNLLNETPINIQVYDISGKLMFTRVETKERTINLSSFNKGIYILKLSQNGNLVYRKLVVK